MAMADAVILGHIHMNQIHNITGFGPAVYAGSIFRKNFGERGQAKGF